MYSAAQLLVAHLLAATISLYSFRGGARHVVLQVSVSPTSASGFSLGGRGLAPALWRWFTWALAPEQTPLAFSSAHSFRCVVGIPYITCTGADGTRGWSFTSGIKPSTHNMCFSPSVNSYILLSIPRSKRNLNGYKYTTGNQSLRCRNPFPVGRGASRGAEQHGRHSSHRRRPGHERPIRRLEMADDRSGAGDRFAADFDSPRRSQNQRHATPDPHSQKNAHSHPLAQRQRNPHHDSRDHRLRARRKARTAWPRRLQLHPR